VQALGPFAPKWKTLLLDGIQTGQVCRSMYVESPNSDRVSINVLVTNLAVAGYNVMGLWLP
jgi:hypothetical protein